MPHHTLTPMSSLILPGPLSLVPRRMACWRALLCLLIGLGSLGSTSCTTRPGQAFRPAFLEGDQNVIYVFRSPGTFNGSRVRVFINQELVGTLQTGEYLAHEVGPGEFFVRVEAVSSSAVRVNFVGGESAYLQVSAAAVRPTPVIEIVQNDRSVELISATQLAPDATADE
ncbi:MAG: hypothetical protein H7210_10655 [Pyrinomonadaceae bacterium]|nr:hypothetical protein [Phycisphaerales bacterium]